MDNNLWRYARGVAYNCFGKTLPKEWKRLTLDEVMERLGTPAIKATLKPHPKALNWGFPFNQEATHAEQE